MEATPTSNESTEQSSDSNVVWGRLEGWVMRKAREFVRDILREEATEFLGRRGSKRLSGHN